MNGRGSSLVCPEGWRYLGAERGYRYIKGGTTAYSNPEAYSDAKTYRNTKTNCNAKANGNAKANRYTEAYGYAEPDRTYKGPGTYTGSCEKAKEYYKSQNEIKKKEDACRILEAVEVRKRISGAVQSEEKYEKAKDNDSWQKSNGDHI